MELIPILSLIILVSTISTFILAVGAYVLYKIRERKGRIAKAKPPETIPAELVEPKQILTEQKFTKTGEKGPVTTEKAPTRFTSPELTRPRMFTQTSDKELTGFQTRPTFATQTSATYAEDHFKRTATGTTRESSEPEKFSRKKFMRYTSEGNEDQTKQKKNREDNLQWR